MRVILRLDSRESIIEEADTAIIEIYDEYDEMVGYAEFHKSVPIQSLATRTSPK